VEREFWRQVRAGLWLEQAAAAAGVSVNVAGRWFRDGGGMPTVSLAEPSGRYLSMAEREEIAIGIAAGEGVRTIARRLGRAPSTVSRELRRNCAEMRNGRPRLSRYRARSAQERAELRARRPKPAKLVTNPALRDYVQDALSGPERCSPEQIAHRLVVDFPDDEGMRISPETIYQALYVQGRGALRRELATSLRPGRAMRGHWEGDLIIGRAGTSAIGTLVERSTRFTMLLHLHDQTAETVREAITATIATLPAALRRSLTWDQGNELAQHVRLRLETGLQVYFCDPHSPWQRGTNENTNGLLRQYFPKGSDLSVHDPDHLAEVAAGLNRRPRKTLQWRTPAEALAELLNNPEDPVLR
jgi:IS30 family transposase